MPCFATSDTWSELHISFGPINGQYGKDNSKWNVEPDGSCGYEVTTRILRGEAEWSRLMDGCWALLEAADSLGLKASTV